MDELNTQVNSQGNTQDTQNAQNAKISAKSPSTIQQMFAKIAHRYDLANSILSFGIHSFWKKKLVSASGANKDSMILDCATGTGDLAFLFESCVGSTDKIIGTDFCEPMLQIAREKAKKQNSKVRFENADLMALPFSDGQFDIVSISFGIRNVKDPFRALSELLRVTKPNGKVLVLEFGQPRSAILKVSYRLYSDHILPRLGGWVSGEKKAYHYLSDSSAVFPCGERFIDRFVEVSRSTPVNPRIPVKIDYRPLFGGIAYLYQFQRI